MIYDLKDERRYAGLVRHVCSIGESDSPLGNSEHWQIFYRIASKVPEKFWCEQFRLGLRKLEEAVTQ